MRRREFIAGLSGAVAWPVVARAQQATQVRLIGMLSGLSDDDPDHRSTFGIFVRELTRRGWTDGGNIRIEQRWTRGDVDRARIYAQELVRLQPEVIYAVTTPATAALHRETTAIPIVFVTVSDPVGAGFVADLARPNGNITGFINIEAAMGGKWLQLLAEIAPHIKSAAIMFNPATAPGGGDYFLGSFEAAARSLAIQPVAARVHTDAEIEATITSLGRERAGLVLMTDSFIGVHRGKIISSAM
jgi:putative tryptophan/tyrosine transport system substrate-binding protein